MDREELGGEYDNSTDLMGINIGEDLLGLLAKLPKEKQAAVANSIVNGKRMRIGGGSRAEMEAKFKQLPKEIRDGLLNKRLQLADTRFYIVKDIAAKSQIDMWQGTDQKNVGLGNLANQKLEKDNWFIISAIRMLYAVNADGKEKADFNICPPEILNGEFELEAGQKKVFGPTTNELFDSRNRTTIPVGFYKIESTKIIEPQVEIKMPVKFTAAAAANAWLKVVFIGTSVIPF
jgi:hypothetical protein